MPNPSNIKVNTFFIGAAKSGTTSIYKSFEDSNAFALPFEKEPNYFNTGSSNVPGKGPGDSLATVVIREENAYHKNILYPKDRPFSLAMDFSVAYLYDDKAPANIHKYNSTAKFVAILRNPVDRAWSHYMHLMRDCRETLSFEDALEEEISRIRGNFEFSWHYFKMGLYSEQLERFLDTFKRDQIKIVLFEDLLNNSNETFIDLLQFIGAPNPEQMKLSNEKFNATGATRSKLLAYIINRPSKLRLVARNILPRKLGSSAMNWIRKNNLSKNKVHMNLDTRQMLIQKYASEFSSLSKLIGRDLDHWKKLK